MEQASLFDLPTPAPRNLPDGLVYEPEFLSRTEEAELIELIATLPLSEAKYKSYTARRRVISYGGSFDYDANTLRPAEALIESLHPLRQRVARWLGVEPLSLKHTLVAEYKPGTPLGWHRDVPDFEQVVGISLGNDAVLRFRPYPPVQPKRSDVVKLTVAARSIYLMQGPSRWAWQHSVQPVDAMRWSITFRTLRLPPTS
ncbi:MAG: 2OG-Fe(II) oxygenase [Rhizobacter sp.]|nr:2OG-Fe(II) oxygenase [Rhizobacter sp.]